MIVNGLLAFFDVAVDSMENVELVRAKLAFDAFFVVNLVRELFGSVLREARVVLEVDLITMGATMRGREIGVDDGGLTVGKVALEMVTRLTYFGAGRTLAVEVIVLVPDFLLAFTAAMRSAMLGLRYELRTANLT